VYSPLEAILVTTPRARGGKMMRWVLMKEFSKTVPQVSPPEMWSPTLT
jgi:hypothetical protein